jgi:NifU-like protein involved in Fe-S cluster formation
VAEPVQHDPVQEHFRRPQAVGLLAPGHGVTTARAGTPGSKAVLQLSLRVEHGVVAEARFLAFGCPSVIATGSWLCGWLRGRTTGQALGLRAADVADALRLAPVKRFCGVLAEDVLRAALSTASPD